MTCQTRFLLATGVGLALGQLLTAAEPARLGVKQGDPVPRNAAPVSNQQVADAIAQKLRECPQVQGFKIDILYQNGTAQLTGCVGNMQQRLEVNRLVRSVAGVANVVDRMVMLQPVIQVQAPMPQAPDVVPPPRKVETPPVPGGEQQQTGPIPIYQNPSAPYQVNTPRMPPYAWPTYAPYNNLSRVAYPTAYPYNAWPFIGPVYPFPKVPIGWRSVKLEWADGHWWFGKVAQNHDWWRLRYW